MFDRFSFHLIDRSEVLACRPQAVAMIGFQRGIELPQLSRTRSLQVLNHLCYRLGRSDADEKVDMIRHHLHCLDPEPVPLRHRK